MFLDDFKKPFNIMTTILAIGSIILAAYFYYNPKKNKKLSYEISEPQQIYDSKLTSPKFILIDYKKQAIKNNVYIVSATVWNSGSEPIEPSDNRKPFLFKISKCYQILDYKITREKDKTVSAYKLSPHFIPENTLEKSIRIDWNHFDPNNGLSFQVIFVAASDFMAAFDVQVLGLESLSDAKPFAKRYVTVTIVITAILVSGLLNTTAFLLRDLWKRDAGWKRLVTVSVTILVSVIIFVVMVAVLRGNPPPF